MLIPISRIVRAGGFGISTSVFDNLLFSPTSWSMDWRLLLLDEAGTEDGFISGRV